jgi:serine/threonine-protein kinase
LADSRAADAGVKPGDLLAGKYRVERVLGVGGMGVVVSAHHLQLDERVALKFLLPETLGNPEALTRFEREARAAVKIKSEHVARVTDVGHLDAGTPYMVMEYLEGTDLDAWLHERGRLSVEQAVEFVLQACEAIAEAHALGIVHRDLKPANLFCIRRADGLLSVKVLDFGISKVSPAGTSTPGSDESLGITKTSAVVGSPLYMSPEQLKSAKRADARSDIWSLGVILFELVGGKPPFEAESIADLAIKIVTEEPQRLRNLVPGVPAAFEAVLARCMEMSRERRFQNVGELAAALAPFAPPHAAPSVQRILRTVSAGAARLPSPSAHAITALAPGEELLPTKAAGTVSSWGLTGNGTSTKRVKLLAIAGGGVSLVLLAVVVVLLAGRRSSQDDAHAEVAVARAQAEPVALPAASVTLAPPPQPTPPSPPASAEPTAPAPPPTALAVQAAPAPARKPVVQPRTSAGAGAAAPAAKASCDPPYYVDSAGHRQFRPECL